MPDLNAFNLNRQQVAELYIDLMDIVGIDSPDGRLDAFVAKPPVVIRKASK